MAFLVPHFIDLMMDHPDGGWGPPYYPGRGLSRFLEKPPHYAGISATRKSGRSTRNTGTSTSRTGCIRQSKRQILAAPF